MNILHVITTLDVGGAEMHVLTQARGQIARGHALRVLYLKGRGSLAGELRAAGVEQVERVSPAGFAWRARAHAHWADIVHSHLLKADLLCAACAPLWGRAGRLVASKHNDEQVLRRPGVGRLHGFFGRVPQRTIVLSDHVGRFMVEHGRLPPEKLVRIYYGLDPAPFEAERARRADVRRELLGELGIDPQAFVFLCVARFAPQKAHADLLEGFARARSRGGPLALLLVGDDPFGDGRERAQARADELGLGASVRFTGIRRDVPRLLAASDVFVMTSLWEGLGLVFLEAMASSLPVLATRVSAVPEVVEEGRTGLLVAARAPDELAAAMLRLHADPQLCLRLGAAGRERVREHFGLERMIESTLGVYREVLSRAGSTPAPARS